MTKIIPQKRTFGNTGEIVSIIHISQAPCTLTQAINAMMDKFRKNLRSNNRVSAVETEFNGTKIVVDKTNYQDFEAICHQYYSQRNDYIPEETLNP